MTEENSLYGNVQVQTGQTYQFDSTLNGLMDDPYTIGKIDLSKLTIPTVGSVSLNAGGGLYSSTNTQYNYNNSKIFLNQDGIQLDPECDIQLGRHSLKDFMERVEERLAILTPNPKLEKDWTELKELGDKYRQLEKEITEKMKTWDILSRDDTGKKFG